MRVLVTGAGGFVGRALVEQLSQLGHALTVTDRVLDAFAHDDPVRRVTGDIRLPQVQQEALVGVEAVIHLATVAGGAAETDPQLAREVNVDATMALSAQFGSLRPGAPFVFASSIAVLGHPLPDTVDDDTPLAPRMLYGAHKAMMEQWLATLSRRNELSAISLRLPGIVARPPGPSGMKSAFISEIFHAIAAGRSIDLPVSPEATMWLMSVEQVSSCLAHGLESATAELTSTRAVTLPAVRTSMRALVAEICRQTARDERLVSYRPDADIELGFGRQPLLCTPAARRLGFTDDDDIVALVQSALRKCDTELI